MRQRTQDGIMVVGSVKLPAQGFCFSGIATHIPADFFEMTRDCAQQENRGFILRDGHHQLGQMSQTKAVRPGIVLLSLASANGCGETPEVVRLCCPQEPADPAVVGLGHQTLHGDPIGRHGGGLFERTSDALHQGSLPDRHADRRGDTLQLPQVQWTQTGARSIFVPGLFVGVECILPLREKVRGAGRQMIADRTALRLQIRGKVGGECGIHGGTISADWVAFRPVYPEAKNQPAAICFCTRVMRA